MLPLKRSEEYKSRVRSYAKNLVERYRPEIADVFLGSVKRAESLIHSTNHAGIDVPYFLAGRNVVFKEYYFNSGPAKYCIIYEIMTDCIGLISIWHGMGSRDTGNLTRLWS
jgi:hypothetical protein